MANNKRTAHDEKTVIRYIIKKNGKRYNSKTFDNYEQARSYVRKKLRSDKSVPIKTYDNGWTFHNNPSITDYGFRIEKKAA